MSETIAKSIFNKVDHSRYEAFKEAEIQAIKKDHDWDKGQTIFHFKDGSSLIFEGQNVFIGSSDEK